MNDIDKRLDEIDARLDEIVNRLDTARFILEFLLAESGRIGRQLDVQPKFPDFKFRSEMEIAKENGRISVNSRPLQN